MVTGPLYCVRLELFFAHQSQILGVNLNNSERIVLRRGKPLSTRLGERQSSLRIFGLVS
jgi:predicted HTH domain antitoxin